MRVLSIITGMTSGGAERVMATLCNSLSTDNTIRLAIIKSSECDYAINSDVEIVPGNVKGQNLLESISFVRKQLLEYSPDVVLSFMTKTNISVLLAKMLVKKRIPVVISERANPYHANLIFKIARLILYPFAQGMVFQTTQAAEYYKKKLKCKYAIIRNPLNPDFHAIAPCEKHTKRIVSVGRLSVVKNHRLLIDAFRLISDKYGQYVMEIYGDGPERDNLDKHIQDTGLSGKVKLMGRREHIEKEINDAELFVLPSDSEGLPNALLEAMALGLACISTDCPIGGPAEIIENDINGILVPVRDSRAMANAIDNILSNRELADRLRTNARKVLKDYNSDTVCSEWERFLFSIADVEKNN